MLGDEQILANQNVVAIQPLASHLTNHDEQDMVNTAREAKIIISGLLRTETYDFGCLRT